MSSPNSAPVPIRSILHDHDYATLAAKERRVIDRDDDGGTGGRRGAPADQPPNVRKENAGNAGRAQRRPDTRLMGMENIEQRQPVSLLPRSRPAAQSQPRAVPRPPTGTEHGLVRLDRRA